jgi:hypothetical protein
MKWLSKIFSSGDSFGDLLIGLHSEDLPTRIRCAHRLIYDYEIGCIELTAAFLPMLNHENNELRRHAAVYFAGLFTGWRPAIYKEKYAVSLQELEGIMMIIINALSIETDEEVILFLRRSIEAIGVRSKKLRLMAIEALDKYGR